MYGFKGKASSPTKKNGNDSTPPGRGSGGGRSAVPYSKAVPKSQLAQIPPSFIEPEKS